MNQFSVPVGNVDCTRTSGGLGVKSKAENDRLRIWALLFVNVTWARVSTIWRLNA